jgi:hypothetical protein
MMVSYDLVESRNVAVAAADTNNNGTISPCQRTWNDGIPLVAQGTEGANPHSTS